MKNEVKLGRLILLEKLPVEKIHAPHTKMGWNYIYKGKYLCFCGKEFIARTCSVTTKITKSCGCWYEYTRGLMSTTHGESNTRLHEVWEGIRKRCFSKKTKQYKDYGGRGITVCKEWNNYEVFRDWALANGYDEKLTIDRINNDGNYEPSNCRWVTQKIQCINKRLLVPNITGYPGVFIREGVKGWNSQIGINGKRIWLGSFDTPEQASEAYEKAKKERDTQYLKEFNEQNKKS